MSKYTKETRLKIRECLTVIADGLEYIEITSETLSLVLEKLLEAEFELNNWK